MEIRIDTKRDSAEDIRKTISFLQNIIGETNAPSVVNTPAEITPSMFGMFEQPPEPPQPPKAKEEDDGPYDIRIIPY
ncbi:MAG: hypothetical protein ABIH41_03440 [Nanoarchaeota archaeon]